MLRAGHEALPAPTSCAAAQTAHCPGPGVPRRRRRKSPGPLGTAAVAPTGSLWLRAAQLLPPREEPWIVGAENWTGEVFEYLYLVLII